MAEQENGGNAEALMLNSKRQRRPSVRLGEIGDFPVAFTIDRPLKQRKKRRVASQPPAALPEVAPPVFDALLGEDQLLMDVDMDADVDMTGFNLDDGGAGSPWDNSSRVPRTRPLEHVSNESPPAAASAPEEAEAEPEAEAEAAGREAGAASKGKGKQKDEDQNEGSVMDGGAGEAPVQAEEPARSVENVGEQHQHQHQQKQQEEEEEENGNLEQEQEQEAEAEAEAEQDTAPEKQQQGNGVVKKGRSRTPKAKYGRRKKSSSSRASAASQRANKSAAEATRRASRNAVDSGASEGECNGDTIREDDDKEREDDEKDRQEELGNEKEEDDGGNDKQEAAEKQSAAVAAPPTHRVTRGSKSLPKDAEYPSKSQQSSKVEKNLRSSRSRQLPPPPPPRPLPPPPTAKDSKGDELDSSGDHEHQQQQIQHQREQDDDDQQQQQHQQQQKQQQQKQHHKQRKQQQENDTLGDRSSGDTGAVKEQAEQEHESFVLPECVKKWLYERRLGKYVELFEFHEVDEDVLPLLTMDDLRDMGIVAIGARRKMFQAIQELG